MLSDDRGVRARIPPGKIELESGKVSKKRLVGASRFKDTNSTAIIIKETTRPPLASAWLRRIRFIWTVPFAPMENQACLKNRLTELYGCHLYNAATVHH